MITIHADPRITKRVLASLASNFVDLGLSFQVCGNQLTIDQFSADAQKVVDKIQADYRAMARLTEETTDEK